METSDQCKFIEKEETLLKEFTEARNTKYSGLKLTFRRLQTEDFDREFLDTLSFLTTVSDNLQGFWEIET